MKCNPMTAKQANAVYDILVADVGALESQRTQFVHECTRGCREYRCCHVFGFGGKFRPETMTVDYYSEDQTPDRDRIQAAVNEKLAKLAERWRTDEVLEKHGNTCRAAESETASQA